MMGEKGREMMMPILRCRPPMCMRSKKPRYSTGLSLSLLPSRNYSISVCGPGKLHFFFEEKQPRNLVLSFSSSAENWGEQDLIDVDSLNDGF